MDNWALASSGLYVPENYWQETRRPIAIDLFSGGGGFSLGMIQAGFDVIAALEMDPPSIHTYLVNLGAHPVKMIFADDDARKSMENYLSGYYKKIARRESLTTPDVSGSNRANVCGDYDGVRYMFVGDARKFSGDQILRILNMRQGEVDVVVGGPPCQGFSRANARRNTIDPRNSLVFEFARLVLEIMPKTICMENVPGIIDMVTPEGIPVMDAFVKVLSDGGFGEYEALKTVLLNTSGCGAAIAGKKKPAKKIPNKKTVRRQETYQPGIPGL